MLHPEYIKNAYNNEKTGNLIKKYIWAKDYTLPTLGIQMVNKPMKICLYHSLLQKCKLKLQ